jgi:hypothetical protein
MPFFESRFSFEPPEFDFTQVLRGNSAQQIVEIFKGTEYGNVDVDILAPPFVQPPLQNNLLSIALAVPTIGMGDGEYLTDFVNNTYPARIFSSPNLFFNRNPLVPSHNSHPDKLAIFAMVPDHKIIPPTGIDPDAPVLNASPSNVAFVCDINLSPLY